MMGKMNQGHMASKEIDLSSHLIQYKSLAKNNINILEILTAQISDIP